MTGATENCGNGTVGGRKGFQPNNKCHGGGARNSPVHVASRAHGSARRAVSKHARAGTLNTPQGHAAVRASAAAARTLQAARATKKSEYAAAAKARRAAAKATAATPAAQATAQLKAAHVAANPQKAAPKPAAKPEAAHPRKAEVVAASKEATDVKAARAAAHISELHAGVKAGVFDEKAAHARVDRIASGHTKNELFDAAKRSGIEHGAATKKALVEHLKAHVTATASGATPGHELPLKDFADRAARAAHASPAGGFGDEKTFISHAHEHLRKTDPAFRDVTPEQFKARLVEAHKARHLELGRADLVEAMHPGDVKASSTAHGKAEYHFIRHPEAPGKGQSRSPAASKATPARETPAQARQSLVDHLKANPPKHAEEPTLIPRPRGTGSPVRVYSDRVEKQVTHDIDPRTLRRDIGEHLVPYRVTSSDGDTHQIVQERVRPLERADQVKQADLEHLIRDSFKKGYAFGDFDQSNLAYQGGKLKATDLDAFTPASEFRDADQLVGYARKHYGWKAPAPKMKSDPAGATAPKASPRAYTDPLAPAGAVGSRADLHAEIFGRENPLHDKYLRSLPKAEKSAMEAYKGAYAGDAGFAAHETFKDVNKALREGSSHPLVPHIDAALARSSVPHDVVVYRGIEDLKHYGFDAPHEAVGSTIHDRSFVSTSLSHHTANTFAGGQYGTNNAIIRATLPKGAKGAYLDGLKNMGENEYLLPRNSSFRVTGYGGKTADGVHILDAEIHHPGAHVGFAEEPRGGGPAPDDRPREDRARAGRFAWKPGDVTVTRPGEKGAES